MSFVTKPRIRDDYQECPIEKDDAYTLYAQFCFDWSMNNGVVVFSAKLRLWWMCQKIESTSSKQNVLSINLWIKQLWCSQQNWECDESCGVLSKTENVRDVLREWKLHRLCKILFRLIHKERRCVLVKTENVTNVWNWEYLKIMPQYSVNTKIKCDT
jgi:hypothetical protein